MFPQNGTPTACGLKAVTGRGYSNNRTTQIHYTTNIFGYLYLNRRQEVDVKSLIMKYIFTSSYCTFHFSLSLFLFLTKLSFMNCLNLSEYIWLLHFLIIIRESLDKSKILWTFSCKRNRMHVTEDPCTEHQ